MGGNLIKQVLTASATVLLLVAAPAQAAGPWTTPKSANGTDPAAAISPNGKTTYAGWIDGRTLRIAVNAKGPVAAAKGVVGTPALAAHRTGAAALFDTLQNGISISTLNGGTWSAPVTVAQESSISVNLQTSADGKTLLAAWESMVDPDDSESPTVLRSSVSTDSGQTWSPAIDVPLAESFERPIFALSSDGKRAVAASIRHTRGDKAIQVTTSSDGGATWDPRVDVITGSVDLNSLDLDASADLQHIALAWTRSNERSDTIYTSVSHDHGATWTAPTTLSKVGEYLDDAVSISENGKNVAVVWTSNPTRSTQALVLARSSDGGQKWGKPVVAKGAKTKSTTSDIDMFGDGTSVTVMWSGAVGGKKMAVLSSTFKGKAWRTTELQRSSKFIPDVAVAGSNQRAVAAWRVGVKNAQIWRSRYAGSK